MKEVSMFFDWKNSIIYRIITGKSPIEPDINKNIGYNALKSIETVPDGVDPEMTSGEKWTVFGNLDRPGMSESGLGVNTGIGAELGENWLVGVNAGISYKALKSNDEEDKNI